MGIGPIPRSAIKAYAKEFAITGDEFDAFYRIIRLMDNEYTSLSSSKKPDDKGLVASADDPERTRAVMEMIKSRAARANKKQRKQKVH